MRMAFAIIWTRGGFDPWTSLKFINQSGDHRFPFNLWMRLSRWWIELRSSWDSHFETSNAGLMNLRIAFESQHLVFFLFHVLKLKRSLRMSSRFNPLNVSLMCETCVWVSILSVFSLFQIANFCIFSFLQEVLFESAVEEAPLRTRWWAGPQCHPQSLKDCTHIYGEGSGMTGSPDQGYCIDY